MADITITASAVLASSTATVENGTAGAAVTAGLVTGEDATNWRDGTFLGIGLQFVPDEPI
ncbi:hypothetical protein [Mesorhizobium sp. M6A.T.Ce.TU.016.01.1.1]|uniref:hypothetical protein n=1 Tax=Mesorhizobium sp. M6A.T.Ce.TU.016.01.1.1 TaxID=2496783 RepID=UPI000FCAD77F|nr:hypothetical protein [Mesorhizobium sp. M6A.T.Ce.TU.016.01.1.1]RUU29757.1 hypothetical protein EOC94_12890 [Mesorhizobium sp. M6A.T.Ce.TU.016.01.1.1]